MICLLNSRNCLSIYARYSLSKWFSSRTVTSSHFDEQSYLKHIKFTNKSLKSSVFRGTLYEYTVKNVLENCLSISNLVRVGGVGDQGIDLLGIWKLNRICKSNEGKSPGGLLSVVIQCKCTSSKMSGKYFRDLTGVLNNLSRGTRDERRSIGILSAPTILTPQGHKQLLSTRLPLIYLQICDRKITKSGLSPFLLENYAEGELIGMVTNSAADDLLQGLNIKEILLSQ
ncbi:hypothetical protein NADFUDRAFT_47102 [Nadsonia fulvescens var. elongata DSM 6958]|uniref:Required for respiratory growth protein 7, mitochondrial n=1 Tax=Nadsonia fulvescens var. elongata DSM 6958 TaxID=857566 RepID=A0A1E3PJ42_9ASCO|nr:hypothetical protein NADFUDRAFT_47102 [Nadsonia fulvescens var. elongata DSM 6958]